MNKIDFNLIQNTVWHWDFTTQKERIGMDFSVCDFCVIGFTDQTSAMSYTTSRSYSIVEVLGAHQVYIFAYTKRSKTIIDGNDVINSITLLCI